MSFAVSEKRCSY